MTKTLTPALLDIVEFEDSSGPTPAKQRGTVVALLRSGPVRAVLIEVIDSDGVPRSITVKPVENVKTVWRNKREVAT